GAAEAEAAFQVRGWAHTLESREQLVAQGFSDALNQIPITLAQNVGLDPIDAAAELTARHARGGKSFGVSARESRINDMREDQVFDPLAVKRQVVITATESAAQILRVDFVLVKKFTNT